MRVKSWRSGRRAAGRDACFGAFRWLPALIVGLALAAVPVVADAQNPPKVNGIGGGGGIFTPAISPYDPNLMFTSCDMGGTYRSTDGGKSWAMMPWQQIENSLMCMPLFLPNDTIIWESNPAGQPVISTNNGQTWQTLLANPPWSGTVILMATDPANTSVLLFGTSTGQVWLSTNSGSNWTMPFSGSRVGALLGLGSNLYACVDNHLYVSSNAGASWTTEPTSMTFVSLAGGTDSSTSTTALYGLTSAGMYKSLDEGVTWTQVDQSRNCNLVSMTTNQTQVVYEMEADFTAGSVYQTTDGGATWNDCFVMGGANGNVNESWLQTVLHFGYEIDPLGFSASPTNPLVALVNQSGDLYLTTDGAKSWNQIIDDPVLGSNGAIVGYRSIGLEVTACWQAAFDPNNANTWYLANTDIGFVRSLDGGVTWNSCNNGCPWENTFYQVVFDPTVPGKIYAACSDLHNIPTWGFCWSGQTGTGGVCVSANYGADWSVLGTGLPNAACTSLALAPHSGSGPLTIYCAMYGYGVYKSSDGGKTWTNTMSSGLGNGGNLHVFQINVAPLTGDVFCSVTANANESTDNWTPATGGIWKSTDGAHTWTNITSTINSGQGLLWPGGIAVDPKNEKTIYLTAASPPGGHGQGGLWKTTDGGTTWTHVVTDAMLQAGAGGDPNSQDFYVSLNPNNSGHVYFGTDHGLWTSPDAGATWSLYSPLPFVNVMRVTFNPKTPGYMYVGTFGGGMWECPDPLGVNTLYVQSTPMTGVAIGSTTGQGGKTNYQVSAKPGASVILSAPVSDPPGYVFSQWTINGATQPARQKPVMFTISAPTTTAVAAYQVARYSLNVQSTPVTGVMISSTTEDGGATNYTKSPMKPGTVVALTAPASISSMGKAYTFQEWTVNGVAQVTGQRRLTETMPSSSMTAVAVYSASISAASAAPEVQAAPSAAAPPAGTTAPPGQSGSGPAWNFGAPALANPGVSVLCDGVVDDRDHSEAKQFTVLSGVWSSALLESAYAGSYTYTAATTGAETARVRFSCTVLDAGRYDVYAWWPVKPDGATHVAYEVHHAAGGTTVRVNQSAQGGQWNLLGTFDFEAGSHVVDVHNGASAPGAFVCADAVRFVRAGADIGR